MKHYPTSKRIGGVNLQFFSAWILICFESTMRFIVVSGAEGTPPELEDHIVSEYRERVGSKSFRLICPVKSSSVDEHGAINFSPPMITWQKGREDIDASWPRFRQQHRNRVLKIRNLQPGDAGQYSCEAVNGFGRRVVEFNLILYDDDGFEYAGRNPSPDSGSSSSYGGGGGGAKNENFKNEDGSDGVRRAPFFIDAAEIHRQQQSSHGNPPLRIVRDPVTGFSGQQLKCLASGSPLPTIQWYRNGLPVPDDQGGREWILNFGLFQEDPTGHYVCTVRNNLGSVRAEFRVELDEEGGLGDAGQADGHNHLNRIDVPKFDSSNRSRLNQTVNEGDTVRFDCRVHSQSVPHIKWLKKINTPRTSSFSTPTKIRGMNKQNQSSQIITIPKTFPDSSGSQHQQQRLLNDGQEYIVVNGMTLAILPESVMGETELLTMDRTQDHRPPAASLRDLNDNRLLYEKSLFLANVQGDREAGTYICVVNSQYGHLIYQFATLHVVPAPYWTQFSNNSSIRYVIITIVSLMLLFIALYVIYLIRRRRSHTTKSTKSSSSRHHSTISQSVAAAHNHPNNINNSHSLHNNSTIIMTLSPSIRNNNYNSHYREADLAGGASNSNQPLNHHHPQHSNQLQCHHQQPMPPPYPPPSMPPPYQYANVRAQDTPSSYGYNIRSPNKNGFPLGGTNHPSLRQNFGPMPSQYPIPANDQQQQQQQQPHQFMNFYNSFEQQHLDDDNDQGIPEDYDNRVEIPSLSLPDVDVDEDYCIKDHQTVPLNSRNTSYENHHHHHHRQHQQSPAPASALIMNQHQLLINNGHLTDNDDDDDDDDNEEEDEMDDENGPLDHKIQSYPSL